MGPGSLIASSPFGRRGAGDSGSSRLCQLDCHDALYIIYPKKDILWLYVCVNDVALVMHVLETDEHLSGDLFD